MRYPKQPITIMNLLNIIPQGEYCYTKISDWIEEGDLPPRFKIKLCPFWRKLQGHPEQENGYCLYMQQGDWRKDRFLLLWDQVKECGINYD